MENFIAYNPTRLHFGRGVVEGLGKTALSFGKTILLVYGKGSVTKNGIYQQVHDQLSSVGCTIIEYSGIRPNPVIEDVDAAAALGRAHRVDAIVAVGGGSTIDSAKIISITIPVDHSGWEFMSGKKRPATAIPLIAVLTLAATGTEMNCFAVVQNPVTREKPGYGHPLIYPKHSFLDPEFTKTVPANQTAYGIVDLIAHALEAYFGRGEASLSDRFVYAVIGEALENGPALMKDLTNYELREKIMYAATCALNGMVFYGRAAGDWGVHNFGHQFSLLYDIPHGATLSMGFPAWMKLQQQHIPERIANLGKNLWGVNTADETIQRFEAFFTAIGSPIRLSQWKEAHVVKEDILQVAIKNKVSGDHHKLGPAEYDALFELMKA